MNSAPVSTKPYTFAHLSGLLSGVAQYFEARLALLTLEAKSAGIRYGIALALGAGGLFIGVLGYVFLVITAVFGIAAAWEWQYAWIAVLGIAALLHFGGAAALILLALKRIKTGAFEDTIDELKKDQEWLTRLTKNS